MAADKLIHEFSCIAKGGCFVEAEGKKHPVGSYMWQNLDYKSPKVFKLLAEEYELGQDVAEAMTDLHTRPRYFAYKDGVVFIMRGMYPNPSAKEKDMVSIRIWVDKEKIITLSHRKIKAIDTVFNMLKKGVGPRNSVDCFLEIADKIAEDIADAVYDISDKADAVEAKIMNSDNVKDAKIRTTISNIRRRIVAIRRHLVPLRDIYVHIKSEKIDLLSKQHRASLREFYNKITNLIEDLEYARDHLTVSFEELQSKVNVRIGKIMYIISIVTIVFLPMNAMTSLLGINVKGIPFAEEPYAFEGVIVVLAAISALLIFLFKKIKWI